MSTITRPYGSWMHRQTEAQHEYQWHSMMLAIYRTGEEKTFAIITSPAALRGTVALSGRSNNYAFNHHVLNNRKMTEEAEEFARAIGFVSGLHASWRPCHAETQLITFMRTSLLNLLAQ